MLSNVQCITVSIEKKSKGGIGIQFAKLKLLQVLSKKLVDVEK